MEPNSIHSERISLQIQLQSKNEQFDYAIEQEDDFETAKLLYQEIKELRVRLKQFHLAL